MSGAILQTGVPPVPWRIAGPCHQILTQGKKHAIGGSADPSPIHPAADEERSNSAPFCCQGGGPRPARPRLRVAPVPLRALDSGPLRRSLKGVGSGGMSVFVSPEECGDMEGAHPLPYRYPLTMPRPSKADDQRSEMAARRTAALDQPRRRGGPQHWRRVSVGFHRLETLSPCPLPGFWTRLVTGLSRPGPRSLA